ncbi:MAG: hypothetical protein KDD50_16580, partial [Bdellovibrionales bacterium]|nr:hypothetical protein [Bdellovibrionales bacterium]
RYRKNEGKMNLKLIFAGAIFLISMTCYAGNESGGGDWFIHSLPLLKIQLPEREGKVEGVIYRRVGLRRCTDKDITDQNAGILYSTFMPDRNWSAYQVLYSWYAGLICSLGQSESDPERALKLLVDNDDMNRVLYENDGQTTYVRYSKSSGAFRSYPQAIGTYLAVSRPKSFYPTETGIFGYNLTTINQELYFNEFKYPVETKPVDFVYIPISIDKSDRVYFIQTVVSKGFPPWRLILPVAIHSENIALAKLTDNINEAMRKGSYSSIPGAIGLPEPYAPDKRPYAWSLFTWTKYVYDLRMKLRKKFGFSKRTVLERPKNMEPQLKLTTLPSIDGNTLNKPAFHQSRIGSEIVIPIANHAWRTAADLVHEVTHALQPNFGSSMTDEQRFQNEMEAHLSERQFISQIGKSNPLYAQLTPYFNYLVGAALPRVEWVDQNVVIEPQKLCEDVIETYNIDTNSILPEILKKYGCGN